MAVTPPAAHSLSRGRGISRALREFPQFEDVAHTTITDVAVVVVVWTRPPLLATCALKRPTVYYIQIGNFPIYTHIYIICMRKRTVEHWAEITLRQHHVMAIAMLCFN